MTRATLRDVALKAGVSIKTVSNVVNRNDARVGPATRARVSEAIAALDYRPNLAARQLRKSRLGVIALAIPALDNPYFTEVANLIVRAATARGYVVLIDHTDGDRESELTIARGLRPDLIDGIILNPLSLEESDILGAESGIPVVLLGERLTHARFDHALIDNRAAAETATAHLIAIGRRRVGAIGLVAGPPSDSPGLRLEGYANALATAGMAFEPDLIIASPIRSFVRKDGALAMRSLLSLPIPPDAVFCFNDLMALGAMRAALETGRRVPEDIAIVGIDDIDDGRYATPSLTTIAPDKQALAHMAVELLIGRIEGARTAPPEIHTVPFDLAVRESTIGRRPGL